VCEAIDFCEYYARQSAELFKPQRLGNLVGGQDELVFDGSSFVMHSEGHILLEAPAFEEGLYSLVLEENEIGQWFAGAHDIAGHMDAEQAVYLALMVGLRDYVSKNNFPGVIIGLSGGVDSALTAVLAVDALGRERVHCVMMPSQYTSRESLEDADMLAKNLNVNLDSIPIDTPVTKLNEELAPFFDQSTPGITFENMQSRMRALILMALSNARGHMLLSTGNKSEMAVGYSTLYGDMAGGFDALKDVPKTLVFELARYRNSRAEVIPPNVLSRPPSAELAPDQKDEDSLPPYDILDEILALYVEQDWSADAIIAQGFEREAVQKVLRLVDVNEYKRRQSPIGVRITQRGFGRDRRYPITSGWKLGE